MDYKKTNAPSSTVTRDMMELCAQKYPAPTKINSQFEVGIR